MLYDIELTLLCYYWLNIFIMKVLNAWPSNNKEIQEIFCKNTHHSAIHNLKHSHTRHDLVALAGAFRKD